MGKYLPSKYSFSDTFQGDEWLIIEGRSFNTEVFIKAQFSIVQMSRGETACSGLVRGTLLRRMSIVEQEYKKNKQEIRQLYFA